MEIKQELETLIARKHAHAFSLAEVQILQVFKWILIFFSKSFVRSILQKLTESIFLKTGLLLQGKQYALICWNIVLMTFMNYLRLEILLAATILCEKFMKK